MLTINGREYRNLEEQVRQNKVDLTNIVETSEMLSKVGIRIVGQVNEISQLPDPKIYQGNYGDAYAVGTKTPYDLFIFTRPFIDQEYPHWFNIGKFPLPGPQGKQGEQGPKGDTGDILEWYIGLNNPVSNNKYRDGDLYLNTTDGYIFRYNGQVWTRLSSIKGPQGIQGDRGIQGIQGPSGPIGPQGEQGPAGESFRIIGELSSVEQLPTPTEDIRNDAYLVNINGIKHLYVIVGDVSLMWVDGGQIQGVPGPRGNEGPQGERGLKGETGDQGIQGETGNGILMTSIDNGIEVPNGKQYTILVEYTDGNSEELRFIAPIGPKGNTGDKGEVGPQGKTGPQGPKGDPGTQILVNGVVQSTFNADLKANVTYVDEEVGKKANTSEITRLEGKINSNTSALNSKANQSTTYSKTEVNDLIASAKANSYKIVSSLPTTGEPGVIYLLPNQNFYDEYLWIGDKYEQIGNTSINLDDYYKIVDADKKFATKVDLKGYTTTQDHNALSNLVDSNTGDIEKNTNAISGLDTRVTNLGTTVNGFDASIKANTSNIQTANNNISGLDGRLDSVEAALPQKFSASNLPTGVKDAADNKEIKLQYSGQGPVDPGYYACWDGYKITYVSKNQLINNLGNGRDSSLDKIVSFSLPIDNAINKGYIKYESGLLIQFGVESKGNGTDKLVNLPAAFSNANYTVVTSMWRGNSTANGWNYFVSRTTTSFKAVCGDDEPAWIAIGRWK